MPRRKFASTNQKHYPDLGSDTSSVWNFWARFARRPVGVVKCRGLFSQPTVPVVFWQYDVHPGTWLADIPLCWIVHLPYCVSKGSCGIHDALCSYIKFLASNHVTNVSPTNYFILFVFFCRKTFIESCIVFLLGLSRLKGDMLSLIAAPANRIESNLL